MRGGPQSAKEDWLSGSRSALAGGVTVVVDQPNTIPPLTTPDAFAARVQDAKEHSLCSFAINSGVTPDTPFDAMWQAGAAAFGETFFAPSSYGDAIDADALTGALEQIQRLGALQRSMPKRWPQERMRISFTMHRSAQLPGNCVQSMR